MEVDDDDYTCNSAASTFNDDISTWDTSGAEDMRDLFHGAEEFNQPLGDWQVAKVTWMENMFRGAKAFNQNIADWNVGKVVYTRWIFRDAWSFNQPLDNWDLSEVINAEGMFLQATSYNQDLGNWRFDNVAIMKDIFKGAFAFDQDLGWCVNEGAFDFYGSGATVQQAFLSTQCESTSCGVYEKEAGTCAPTSAPTTSQPTLTPAPSLSRLIADDSTIRTAVAAWLADSTAAETTYGHISRWETRGVTDMSFLFCVRQDWMEGESWDDCVSVAYFNEDISAWDTSGVTTMACMFYGQWKNGFNQAIGVWNVARVTDMWEMFSGAAR